MDQGYFYPGNGQWGKGYPLNYISCWVWLYIHDITVRMLHHCDVAWITWKAVMYKCQSFQFGSILFFFFWLGKWLVF